MGNAKSEPEVPGKRRTPDEFKNSKSKRRITESSSDTPASSESSEPVVKSSFAAVKGMVAKENGAKSLRSPAEKAEAMLLFQERLQNHEHPKPKISKSKAPGKAAGKVAIRAATTVKPKAPKAKAKPKPKAASKAKAGKTQTPAKPKAKKTETVEAEVASKAEAVEATTALDKPKAKAPKVVKPKAKPKAVAAATAKKTATAAKSKATVMKAEAAKPKATTEAAEPRVKLSDAPENPEFDPRKFKGGNHYKGIVDSSDSDSDDHYVPQPFDAHDKENAAAEEDSDYEFVELPDVAIPAKDDASDEDEFMDYTEGQDGDMLKTLLDKIKGKDKDTDWKKDLKPEEIRSYEAVIASITSKFQGSIPKVVDILRSGMTAREKYETIRLFQRLQADEPFSLSHDNLCRELVDKIRLAPKQADPELDAVETRILDLMDQSMPTREKILRAHISDKDKLLTYHKYLALEQLEYLSDGWLFLKNEINAILDNGCKNSQELEQVLHTEQEIRSIADAPLDMKSQIIALNADNIIKRRLLVMYDDMNSRSSDDNERGRIHDKLRWALKLPYRKMATVTQNLLTHEDILMYCKRAKEVLDASLYGMIQAKEQVLESLNDRIYNPKSCNIIALKGKPGVGKTQLARSMAKAAGLPFAKISLGGTIDASLFKGSAGVWVGGAPSRLLQILADLGVSNGVVLLDEIDKLGTSPGGLEVQHSLLHILDPLQNKDFHDEFLCEFDHDISGIKFIASLNDDTHLDPALRDRLNIIEVKPYTRNEMVKIVQLHTLPETLVDKGIAKHDVSITDDGVRRILALLGKAVEDAGMRPVEKAVKEVVSKLNMLRTTAGSDLKLSYSVSDFHGFPYRITETTVSALLKPDAKDVMPMYI